MIVRTTRDFHMTCLQLSFSIEAVSPSYVSSRSCPPATYTPTHCNVWEPIIPKSLQSRSMWELLHMADNVVDAIGLWIRFDVQHLSKTGFQPCMAVPFVTNGCRTRKPIFVLRTNHRFTCTNGDWRRSFTVDIFGRISPSRVCLPVEGHRRRFSGHSWHTRPLSLTHWLQHRS